MQFMIMPDIYWPTKDFCFPSMMPPLIQQTILQHSSGFSHGPLEYLINIFWSTCLHQPVASCLWQAPRRLWPAWTRRPETSSCLSRLVRSARHPSLCGPRTTIRSATAPACPSRRRAERKLASLIDALIEEIVHFKTVGREGDKNYVNTGDIMLWKIIKGFLKWKVSLHLQNLDFI